MLTRLLKLMISAVFHLVTTGLSRVLSAAGVPSVVFVPSGNLGHPPRWDMEPGRADAAETVIAEGELRRLPNEPVTMGSHSVSHAHLPLLDAPIIELVDSRRAVESINGRPVELFSFPHGAHNPDLVERCRDAGYHRVFITEPTLVRGDDNLFVVGRVPVAPEDWIWEFRLKLAGAYRWVPAASALKRRLRR